jgi:hypothetical protein
MCQGAPVPAGCCDGNDQLNVVMVHSHDDNLADCNHWGGELIWYPSGVEVCENVDH